jgi:glyoxylase-like metal-dependent hydrolase (beta-lactamase superfamily II)
VPAISFGPPIGPSGYHVAEIDNGLHWVTDGYFQSMFLVTEEGVVVADAPPTIGHKLTRAIADVTDQPITHVIYSHSHADHIGAAALYPDGAVRIAHERTKSLINRSRDSNRPLPSITFEDSYRLEVGGHVLELDYRGPNHSPDNIFIFAPQHKTLMVVDVVFPGWVPFRNLAASEDIVGFVEANDHVLSYPFETLVAGHVGKLGDRSDVELQREYLRDLEAHARNALATVDVGPIFGDLGPTGNVWAIFDRYLNEVVDQTTKATLLEWRGRLGGADVFTPYNAYAMAFSLRINGGVLGPFGIAD